MTSFFPLIQANIDNVKELGSENALTGPISRGDINTIKEHLQAFKTNGFNDTGVYRVLGNSTLHLAEKKKLKDKEIALKISKLLEEKTND